MYKTVLKIDNQGLKQRILFPLPEAWDHSEKKEKSVCGAPPNRNTRPTPELNLLFTRYIRLMSATSGL